MRWPFRVFFLSLSVYLLKLYKNEAPQAAFEEEQEPELLLVDEVGFEPEFGYLIEFLQFQLQTEVRIEGGARGKTVSIETDDELIARLSFHKDRHIVVRLSDYHFGLQAWFTAAFPTYKVRFQPLRPIATIKKRNVKKNKTPRGR